MVLLLSSLVFATNYTGKKLNIYDIKTCDGPVKIKALSEHGITNNELQVKDCNKIKKNYWKCDCQNSFSVNLYVNNGVENIYNFVIQYYLDYNNIEPGNGTPSLGLIEQQNNLRIERINNVAVKVEEESFDFTINTSVKNFVLGGILLFVCVLTFFIVKFIKSDFGVSSQNNDIMNYDFDNDGDDLIE